MLMVIRRLVEYFILQCSKGSLSFSCLDLRLQATYRYIYKNGQESPNIANIIYTRKKTNEERDQ